MTAPTLRDCPGYGRFWAASSTSDLGTWITIVALPLLVVETLHGSAADVGLIRAAQWVPYLLSGLVVGVLVDRYRRLPVLVTTDIVRGILLGAVPLLAAFGALDLPTLGAFLIVFGAFSLVHDAAFQSFLPRLVPPALLSAGNARLDQSDSVAQTSGPAVGGALVGVLGAPVTVLVDAVSYLGSGLLLASLRVEEPPARPGRRGDLRHELREGLAWIYRHRTLRPLAITTHGWFACWGAVGAVFVPFAKHGLQLSAAGIGAVLSCAGVGGLLGSLNSTRLGRRFGAGPVVVAAHLLMPVAVALVALAPGGGAHSGWVLAGAGQFLIGVGSGLDNANSIGYRQAITPDHMQARTNATMRSLNRAALVVSAPLGGLLADAAGFRPALWVAAAGFVAVAAGLALSPFRTARIPAVG